MGEKKEKDKKTFFNMILNILKRKKITLKKHF